MPWLGFSFAKRGEEAQVKTKKTKKNEPTSSSSSNSTNTSTDPSLIEDEDDFPSGTDAAPTIRMLRPEELEKLQQENQQLKQLLQQLAERTRQEEEARKKSGGDATSAYPNLAASSSSSTPAEFAFQKIPVHASAPPLEQASSSSSSSSSAYPSLTFTTPHSSSSSSSSAQSPPVADFYAALRSSLAASSSSSANPSQPTSSSITQPQQPASSSHTDEQADISDDLDDEWGDSPAKSKPASTQPIVDSLPTRSEDEAIVHNKHAAIVIRKKPLRPVLDDDDAMSSTAPCPRTAGGMMEDFEDDDFGPSMMESAPYASSVPATSDPISDDAAEEVAIFDVSQADWWYVVPRMIPGTFEFQADQELQAAPPTPLDPCEDEDGFVVIKSKDSIAALGEFISQMMSRHPEIAKLSPEQLRSMIESSLIDRGIAEPPSTAGKVWQWGKQAYSIWSWANWGFSLYKDQTAIRMVAAGVIKAATWTCVFLI